MSFTASNSRIRVTEGNDVIFDTDEDMPHIVATQYIEGVSTNYPDTGRFNYISSYVVVPYTYVVFPPPTYVLVQTGGGYTYYVYVYVPGSYSPGYYDPYGYGGYGGYYDPGYSYSYSVYEPPTYGYQEVYNPPYYVTEYSEYPVYAQGYYANDYSEDTNVANLPVDEAGNPMTIDFIVVQASGSRSAAGGDFLTGGSLLSSPPSGTFSFQGSVLIESGAATSGAWLRRILSLFVDNNTKKLVMRRQSSNQSVLTNRESAPSIASNWQFNFKIFYGRFKS